MNVLFLSTGLIGEAMSLGQGIRPLKRSDSACGCSAQEASSVRRLNTPAADRESCLPLPKGRCRDGFRLLGPGNRAGSSPLVIASPINLPRCGNYVTR